ncbi:hypothetical protein O181_033815 [Austropuccinia psidii MF-1]|uniref:Uncharacterized protein n=1 Tax=Austropuccinia psidii MF-1 TaxID=1389203 RepID=A0A9Q3D1X2_9BASI|nr:hypothetical protein [Austropuccinia psidii MF-1]
MENTQDAQNHRDSLEWLDNGEGASFFNHEICLQPDQEPSKAPQEAPKKLIDVIIPEGEGSVDDFQINKICHSEAYNTALPSNRSETATRSLSEHIQSQPESLQQCITARRVPSPCRFVEKLHEFLPDCGKIPGPSQHLQVTQWMASIDGKEKHDAFNSRME